MHDVFGLIPPPSERDGEDVQARYATIAGGKSKGLGGDTYYGYREDLLGEVRDAFARLGVPVEENDVHLVQGLFEDTVTGDEPVALAHLDQGGDVEDQGHAAVAQNGGGGQGLRSEDLHEAGRDDEVGVVRPDCVGEGRVPARPVRVVGNRDDEGGDSPSLRAVQPGDGRAVGAHRDDLAAEGRVVAGIEDRLEVGAGAGDEDDETHGANLSRRVSGAAATSRARASRRRRSRG